MSALTPRGKATRLRVFSAVKSHMLATGECPFASQIAAQVGIGARLVSRHMMALRHADGLPFPIPETNALKAAGSNVRNEGASWVGVRKRYRDAGAPVEVDLLMGGVS